MQNGAPNGSKSDDKGRLDRTRTTTTTTSSTTSHNTNHGSSLPGIRSSPSSGTASSVPTTSVASLIQSAAKISLLDLHGRSDDDDRDAAARLFADDEYDGNHHHDVVPPSPSLESLQKKALPAMPDEQDRKRFVGCLAAVLASLHDYDQENDERQQGSSSTTNDDPSADTSCFYEDFDDLDDLYSAKVDDSFEYTYFEQMNESTQQQQSPTKRKFLRPRSRRDSSAKQQQQQRFSNSHHPQQQQQASGSSRSNKDALAQKRHRKRRYEVYSRFLASSAELLLLDESQGKCFVPMLSKLLVPQAPKQPKRQEQHQQQPSAYDCLHQQMQDIEHLQVFLEALGPGAGLRCTGLFLLQHLLHSPTGYDARIRHAVKTVGILVLLHDLWLEKQQQQRDDDDEEEEEEDEYCSEDRRHRMGAYPPPPPPPAAATATATTTTSGEPQQRRGFWANPRQDPHMDLVSVATRKFESLEHFIALKLIELSNAQRELELAQQQQQQGRHHHSNSSNKAGGGSQKSGSHLASRGEGTGASSRDRLIRGLKIGGTAVAAGTLFAITGGLAAPGIAAGVATIVGTTAVATAAAALTSTVAVTTIFGVGGGGLVAYKMQRRTVGLTEFEFCKEESPYRKHQRKIKGSQDEDSPDAELFSTICMSGWLRDDHDFQRPWGIMPSRPPLDDRLELLERFYAIHRPGHILKCPKVLESWRGEEEQLWRLLRRNYGRDPDNLFPLDHGPRFRGALTHEQREVVDQIFAQLGCNVTQAGGTQDTERSQKQRTPFELMEFDEDFHRDSSNASLLDSLHGPHSDDLTESFAESAPDKPSSSGQDGETEKDEAKLAKIEHLATVWDYQTTFGGELYSVRWESKLLEELCDSVVDLASDVVTGATTHLLKYTALSALAAAMALPVALKSVANMIDGTWTLVVERTDEAGVELAKSLLFSSAGNRPVTLVGFSFGARAIYSCLKQLALYQEKWEDYQERRRQSGSSTQGKFRYRKSQNKEESDAFFENMREPASIIGDVILMGLPNHLSLSSWKACRRVVAGRLVNCYSRKDLILSLMYQIKKFGLKPVCGTCAVNVAGVENLDVTDLISGHQDYTLVVGEILKRARHGEPFRAEAADSDAKDVGVVEEERRQIAQLRALQAKQR